MSMLTPPGMGGKYRVTGTQYPRMRRPRRRGRIVAAAVSVVAVLGVTGWGSLQLIDVFRGGDGTGAGQKTASCRRAAAVASAGSSASPASTALPKPGAVTVNVYNATSKSGLAKQTADELKARGFRVGTVGNAPPEYDQKVNQPALLLSGPGAQAAAKVLSAEIPGASAFKVDPKRKSTTVDLMIGKGFAKLSAPAQVKKALAALAHPASPAPTASKGC
jgi:hypothetical protein